MRTLIGLVILVIVVSGLVWYAQRDSSFFSKFFNRSSTTQTTDEGDSLDTTDDAGISGIQEEDLLVCTPELFSTNCSSVKEEPVCSVDVLIDADGTQSTSRTEYISVCHYCKFFGSDNVVELGDERVETKGYTVGSCTVSNTDTSVPSNQKGGN